MTPIQELVTNNGAVLLRASGISVSYRQPSGSGRHRVRAVEGVDITLHQGKVLGLVGESGCGKSTLSRALVGLVPLDSGTVMLDSQVLGRRRSKQQRRLIQMVFQDVHSALNPRMTVNEILEEALRVHRMRPRKAIPIRVAELLDLVHLPIRAGTSRAAQLSGGQRQRVGIARALALEPRVLIADEAVSALDVSVQASVLNLLLDIRDELGLSMLFVSHNLAVVRHVADAVAVMFRGRVVETAPANAFFSGPEHPYSLELLRSVPKVGVVMEFGQSPRTGIPRSLHVGGCNYVDRCPIAVDACADSTPNLVSAGAAGPSSSDHRVACFRSHLKSACSHQTSLEENQMEVNL